MTPATKPAKCVAANGSRYTGVATVVANSIVVNPMLNPWVLDPVAPIPTNTPWGLALAGAALAFFGRKRIQKAFSA